MNELYLIQVRYEKNANDGITYYTSKEDLALGVYEEEQLGAIVQVYKCVPVDHEVYTSKVSIELSETNK